MKQYKDVAGDIWTERPDGQYECLGSLVYGSLEQVDLYYGPLTEVTQALNLYLVKQPRIPYSDLAGEIQEKNPGSECIACVSGSVLVLCTQELDLMEDVECIPILEREKNS